MPMVLCFVSQMSRLTSLIGLTSAVPTVSSTYSMKPIGVPFSGGYDDRHRLKWLRDYYFLFQQHAKPIRNYLAGVVLKLPHCQYIDFFNGNCHFRVWRNCEGSFQAKLLSYNLTSTVNKCRVYHFVVDGKHGSTQIYHWTKRVQNIQPKYIIS